MTNQRPILITGSHRSGTTWVGRMISAAPNVGYIHEPFNIDINIGINPRPFKYWFYYLCEENVENYEEIFDDILAFRYPLIKNIVKLRTARNLARLTRDKSLYLMHYIRRDRALIKDPIAIFSSEWLYKTFDMDVLILIRHPAAFCSSLKIMNWKFDFNNFLNQPLLMKHILYPFDAEIKEYANNEKPIVDQAILLWNCIHYYIIKCQELYPDWIFVTHEALSLDPCNQFQALYEKLNLGFTNDAVENIKDSSGVHNPIEQLPGAEFKRNSKKNIKNWKNRLSGKEVEMIRVKTSAIADLFYTERDW